MNIDTERTPIEKPASFWNRVYVAVVITTAVVIAGLWAFSYCFSR